MWILYSRYRLLLLMWKYLQMAHIGIWVPIGIVMSLYSLTKVGANPTPHEIEEAFDGNLCRCTGYRPILEGAQKVRNGPSI